MNEKSLPAQKNESVYVIFYGSPITICGYALSQGEAIGICARHNAVYPFAPRYEYLKIGRLHGERREAQRIEEGGKMSKTKAFTLSDSFISGIMAGMGCDCGKTDPHWVPNTMWGSRRITPEQAILYDNGWLCSVCGKHAWSKYRRCSGCGSTFADYEDAGTSPE